MLREDDYNKIKEEKESIQGVYDEIGKLGSVLFEDDDLMFNQEPTRELLLKDSQSRSDHKSYLDKISSDIKNKFEELKSKNDMLERTQREHYNQMQAGIGGTCQDHEAEILKLRGQLDKTKSQMKNEAKTEKDLLQQTKRLLKETKDRIEKMTIDF